MTRRRAAAPILLLVGLIGTLVGCGDDGDEPQTVVTETVTESVSPSPTETTAPTESPTETPTPSVPATTAPSAVDLSQPPSSYEEALAHIEAARASAGEQQLDRFQSADEQFYCSFGEKFIRPSCEILEGITDRETCADSMSPKVGRIELTRRGWAAFCNTDTVRQPGATVLAEGGVATWSAKGVGCVLESIGLTCVETAGQGGFFLTPGSFQLF